MHKTDNQVILYEQNPWWRSGKVEKPFLGDFEREIFDDLVKELSRKEVTILFGPRRSGKTTLLYELVNYLIEKKNIDSKRILFLNFDNFWLRKALLRDSLNIFLEILGESLVDLSAPIYIFLDEIHLLPKWSSQVKEIFDLKKNIKIYVSGSSGYKIIKGGGESLIGRSNYFRIMPFSFFERVNALNPRLRLPSRLNFDNHLQEFLPMTNEYNKALRDYFFFGGFPEVLNKSREEVFEIIKTYKSLILQRDILEMKKITEPMILSDLFALIADRVSSKISITNLASDLGIKFDTARKYLTYMEEANLIRLVKPFSHKKTRSLRKERKLYLIDNAFSAANILSFDLEKAIPSLAENSVFIERFGKISPFDEEIYYGASKNFSEIDFVFLEKKNWAVEVKWQERINSEDEKYVWEFSKMNPKFKPLLVTEKDLDFSSKVPKIPLFLYLLLKKEE